MKETVQLRKGELYYRKLMTARVSYKRRKTEAKVSISKNNRVKIMVARL